MPAEQFWRRQIHQAALVLIDQPPALDIDMPILPRGMQRRAHALCLLLDHGDRLGWLLRRNRRHAALDDRGLFARDRHQAVAEIFGVVHADRRDHGRQRRLDHIVASSRPRDRPQQRHIGRMPREQPERRRRLDFENGDRRARH